MDASVGGTEAGYEGVAVTANGKAVFAPGRDYFHICQNFDNTRVGILDLATSQWETFQLTDCGVDPPTPLPANGWRGAAAVGNKVVFAPADQWHEPNIAKAVVGIFDVGVQPYTFTRVDITNNVTVSDTRELFNGAVAIGSVVVFTPHNSGFVGVYDLSNTAQPYRQAVPNGGLAPGGLTDAVAVGNKAVFCPYRHTKVVTFEPGPDTFEITDVSGKVTYDDYGFHGAAAVGTKVYCAPWYEKAIGVYDVETRAFDLVAAAVFQSNPTYSFYSAASLGPIVYFAPAIGDVVLSLDTRDNSTATNAGHGARTNGGPSGGIYSYYSGTAVMGANSGSGTVIFSPLVARDVLLIRVGIASTTATTATSTTAVSTTTTTTLTSTAETTITTTVFATVAASVGGIQAGYEGVAVTANGKAVFAPGRDYFHICQNFDNTRVGILDLATSQWETFQLTDCGVDPPTPLPANGWRGAAAVGNKVVFAPADQWHEPNIAKAVVGIFDVGVQPYTFTRVDITNNVTVSDTRELFNGAVAIGSVVVFTPHNSGFVGVYDLSNTAQPYRQAVPNGGLAPGGLTDAVAVGNKAVFCPYRRKKVVTFEPGPDTFEITDVSGKVTYDDYGFHGAAAVGTKVYCAPWNEKAIGVYDVETGAFDLVAAAVFQSNPSYSFYSAASLGPIVYFAPAVGDVVLSLDTRDNSIATNPWHGAHTRGRYSYYSGTAVMGADSWSGTVIFSPLDASDVLLIRVGTVTSTELQQDIAAGSRNIPVADVSDFKVGDTIRISDASASETRTVIDIVVGPALIEQHSHKRATSTPGILVLDAPLANAYQAQESASVAISESVSFTNQPSLAGLYCYDAHNKTSNAYATWQPSGALVALFLGGVQGSLVKEQTIANP